METITAAQVFLFALLTALATGLGALPFLFLKGFTRRWPGVSNAGASGLILAASTSRTLQLRSSTMAASC